LFASASIGLTIAALAYFIIGMSIIIIQAENLDTPQAIGAIGTFLAVIGVTMAFPGAVVMAPIYGIVLAIVGLIFSMVGQKLSAIYREKFYV
jgi:hypothetical protein